MDQCKPNALQSLSKSINWRNTVKNQFNHILAAISIGGLCALAAPATQAANLLTDGAFDLNNPLSTFAAIVSPQFLSGQWAVENAAIVSGPSDGVNPSSTGLMLRMLDDGLITTQAGQAVAISPGASIHMGAEFTTGAGVSGAVAALSLSFYNGNFSNPIGVTAASFGLDNLPDWQLFSLTTFAPLNANWVLAQVMYNNASLGSHAGYVDNVTLQAVPEPSNLAMFAAGLASIIYLRRRTTSPGSGRSLWSSN